jgi:hypothetical protein
MPGLSNPGKPNDISNVVVTPYPSALLVTWVAPTSGHLAYDYHVRVLLASTNEEVSSYSVLPTTTEYYITGLTPGTAYKVYVQAERDFKKGTEVGPITGTPLAANASALQAPTVTSTTPGATSVTLAWNAPSSGLTPTDYNVRVTDYYSKVATLVYEGPPSGPGNTHTQTGLTPNTHYSVSVQSLGSGNTESPYTTPVVVFTYASPTGPATFVMTGYQANPNPPVVGGTIVALANTNQFTDTNWLSIAMHNTSSGTDYPLTDVEYTAPKHSTDKSGNPVDTPATISGTVPPVPPGTNYTLRVYKPVSGFGEVALSEVDYGSPTAPRNFTATPETGGASLSWSTPSYVGSGVTGYAIWATNDDTGQYMGDASVGANTLTYDWVPPAEAALDPAHSYTFSIVALADSQPLDSGVANVGVTPL